MSTQRRVRPGDGGIGVQKRPRASAAGVALMLGGAGILLGWPRYDDDVYAGEE